MKKFIKSFLVILIIGCMKTASAGVYYAGHAWIIANGLQGGSPSYTLKCSGIDGTCCWTSGNYIVIYHWSGTYEGWLNTALQGTTFPTNGAQLISNDPIHPDE